MSRGQQTSTFNTASGENKNYNNLANTSFSNTQGDINSYADAVGAFKAANPFVQGGQAQTVENQELSDTAAGGAQAAGNAVQSAAVRTGQNTGGAIAATESIAAQNDRTLAGQEAAATEQRLGAGTSYEEAGLKAGEVIPGMEDTVAQQEGQLAQGALNTQEQAAQTPSFMDELGGSFASGFGQAAGGAASGMLFGNPGSVNKNG
jgi:hypothetical protein